jgi:hypothetical protein
MNLQPKAMRPPAAAIYTGLTEQRLARLRHEGGGPVFTRAGRSILYRVEDLDAWLNANRRTSTSARPAGAVDQKSRPVRA